jgi:hypothetical protein
VARLVNEMALIVDFNMIEADGRIPALVPAGERASFAAGAEVVAVDGEGTECRAIVDEVSADGSYVMLSPIEGTFGTSTAGPDRRAGGSGR